MRCILRDCRSLAHYRARYLFYQDFVFGNSFSELSGFFFSRHRWTTYERNFCHSFLEVYGQKFEISIVGFQTLNQVKFSH